MQINTEGDFERELNTLNLNVSNVNSESRQKQKSSSNITKVQSPKSL